jgi:RHS repeat-associated protein
MVTGTHVPSFSNAYNQLTAYTYDASGNMLTDATNSYTWNAEGKEASVAGSYTYTYDGDGKRVENSFNGYYYWFSPEGVPLAETNTSGATQNEYIYFNGARTARHDSTTNVYYYFSDQIHSAQTITNSSGTVCYDSDFTPFGYEMAYTTSCPQDYKFAGMERDGFTGNDHTRFRNYEENLGRWMSPDPAGLAAADATNPQTWNQYAYVLNDPPSLTDSLGLFESAYENGGGCGGGRRGGIRELPLRPMKFNRLVPVPCTSLTLNNPSTFYNNLFASPDQVEAFFASQSNAPTSWNGMDVGFAALSAGLNPGLLVGIVGAETSFGNAPKPLSPGNIKNPFSANGATTFAASVASGVQTVMKLETHTYTPGTPLSALINFQNSLNPPIGQVYELGGVDTQQTWINNVNVWFRKFAKFLGDCYGAVQ